MSINIKRQTMSGAIIQENDRIAKHLREEECIFCGQFFGGRKVAEATDGEVVHRRNCEENYNHVVAAKKLEAQRIKNENERAEIDAKHEQTIERRGTDLNAWCKSVMETLLGRARTNELSKDERNEQYFFDNVMRELERSDKELKTFIERVQEDPAHAMEWSMSAFAAAAKIKVHSQIKYWFEKGLSVEEIKTVLDQETFRAARSTSYSTSQASNLMEREILAVYANVCKPWS